MSWRFLPLPCLPSGTGFWFWELKNGCPNKTPVSPAGVSLYTLRTAIPLHVHFVIRTLLLDGLTLNVLHSVSRAFFQPFLTIRLSKAWQLSGLKVHPQTFISITNTKFLGIWTSMTRNSTAKSLDIDSITTRATFGLHVIIVSGILCVIP